MAAHSQDGGGRGRANCIGCIALILSGILTYLEVCDTQLSVIVFICNEESARGVVDFRKYSIDLLAPHPVGMGEAHRLAIHDCHLPFIFVLTSLVDSDIRTSFHFYSGVGYRRVSKHEHT